MPLTRQTHQGLHGEGFVFAMACAAGLQAMRPIYDVDGVDWTIGHSGALGSVRSPKIEVQVKTWSKPPLTKDAVWRYPLSVKHFNALAGPGFAIPRFLVLVTVPPSATRYATCNAVKMSLCHAAYWVSLADRAVLPEGEGERKTVIVEVPQGNLLTPESLVALLAGSHEGTS
jgi:hypothetical protein